MIVTLQGDSRTLWTVDETTPADLSRRSTPFIGWETERPGRRVWVQRVLSGKMFAEDREHLRAAYENGQREAVLTSPFVRQVADRAEPANLYLMLELADFALTKSMRANDLGPATIEEIRAGISSALAAIHAADLVHCDVQPANVLYVGGTWKLADLGSLVAAGSRSSRSRAMNAFVIRRLTSACGHGQNSISTHWMP